MDYLNADIEQKRIDLPDYQEALKSLSHPRVVSVLKKAGYYFQNRSIFDMDGKKAETNDLVISHEQLLTINNFYHLLTTKYIPYLKVRRAIKNNPDFHDPVFYFNDNYNNKRVAEVAASAKIHTGKPQFVYAHFLTPHFPFYFDSAGNYLPPAIAKSVTEGKSFPFHYWNNVKHANQKILQLVDAIMENEHGNAVILVMGDHGFRNEQKVKNKEKLFRNLSAVYFPDGDYKNIPDSMTNVNVFRIVLNRILGSSYPMLENRCIELGEHQGNFFKR